MTHIEYKLRELAEVYSIDLHKRVHEVCIEAADELARIRQATGTENLKAAKALLKDYERLKEENEELKRRARSPIKSVTEGLLELE